MKLPRFRVTGPGFPARDDDPVRCTHCPATVRRDALVGVVLPRAVYVGVCPDCAHKLAPHATIIDPKDHP